MHIPFSAAYSPAAAILVGTPLFGLLLCRIGFSGLASWVGRMVRLELTENDQILVEQLNSGALLLAGMGVIFGMIHVLRNLANPDAIGPGIALVFVTLVYGALVPVLLLPFHNRRTVNRLMKEAAVFAFLVSPLSVGVALSAFHIAKVF
ncbi:MAG: MotA/TolQ/ExbB proton channel family protein [Bdellovibrionota bacterium]